MQYYHNIITEKSFSFLTEFAKKFNLTLIGGWAVFLYTHALKSKDIDVIVGYSELGKMRDTYRILKNDRLKKYEIKTGEFDVDIYLPHYSELGIPAETIIKHTIMREGFRVPSPEILFFLKLYAWHEREGTPKGEKDKIDIFGLAFLSEFNWGKYQEFIRVFALDALHRKFMTLLRRTIAVPELDINANTMAKQKKKILPYLDL